MAKFIVETTAKIYRRKDSKFRVESIIKFKLEATIKIHSPKDLEFGVETTDWKLKKEFLVTFWSFEKNASQTCREARKSECRN